MTIPLCPVCGRAVEPEETELRNGWHIGCYQRGETPEGEHYVGVVGDTRDAAIVAWRSEVAARSLLSEIAGETK